MTFVNRKHIQNTEYEIALEDRFGFAMILYRGFYNPKTNEWKLYPKRIFASPGAEYATVLSKNNFDIKTKPKANEGVQAYGH